VRQNLSVKPIGGSTLALAEPQQPQRFLFVTLGHIESDFYERVGGRLAERGHAVAHITVSRRAAMLISSRGFTAYCLADRVRALPAAIDVQAEVERIAQTYDTPTFRDIYRTDFVCDGRPEQWAIERAVKHVLALESIFDEWSPDILVPEVGNETVRIASHLIALKRGVRTLFLFYTIFPAPLRLYVDHMQGPIADPKDVRPLMSEESARVEKFVADFLRRDKPIRDYRSSRVTPHRTRMLARHFVVRTLWDADNEYLRPLQWALGLVRERTRSVVAERLYDAAPTDRPYVYFPLHMTDDYKLKRLIPDCADQLAIIAQVARALPQGYDLVVKEHPLSIGRNPLTMLHRLRRMRNVRLVPPRSSSHALIAGAQAVAVISSTVGLEALLQEKPVLTIGRPFYAGFGVTVDLDGPVGIREAVPELLRFRPDHVRIREFLHAAMERCYPGAPVLIDRGDKNARELARSLELAATAMAMTAAPARSTADRRR